MKGIAALLFLAVIASSVMNMEAASLAAESNNDQADLPLPATAAQTDEDMEAQETHHKWNYGGYHYYPRYYQSHYYQPYRHYYNNHYAYQQPYYYYD